MEGVALMNGRSAHWLDSLRTRLWPLPLLAVTLAVAVVLTVWSFVVYIHRYRDLFSTSSGTSH